MVGFSHILRESIYHFIKGVVFIDGKYHFWCILTLGSHLSSGDGRRGGHSVLQARGAGVQTVLCGECLEGGE